MVYEVVDNAIDSRWPAGGDLILVTLNGDGSLTVNDNGRGIPPDPRGGGRLRRPGGDDPAPCRRQVRQNSYKVSGGLHARRLRGHALSEHLDLRIWGDGKEHFMRFRDGDPEAPLAVVGRRWS